MGSIGVVSFVPNIRGLLERVSIEPRTFTAGDYKRTVTMTDNATPEEIKHYEGKLQNIHDHFKEVVTTNRKGTTGKDVLNGDYWLAADSVKKELDLVDEIKTSSSYLLELNQHYPIVQIVAKKNFMANIKGMFGNILLSFFGKEYISEGPLSLHREPRI